MMMRVGYTLFCLSVGTAYGILFWCRKIFRKG